MPDTIAAGTPFGEAVREQTRLLEICLLAVVPAVMVGVYVLPRPVQMDLVLYYSNPTLLTAYTSQFVHLSLGHLLINLVFYALLVPTIYLYWALAGRRKTFLVIFAVVVLFFPFLLTSVNLSLVRDRFGYGFSGMNAAFLGSLPLALVEYLRTQLEMDLDLSDSPFYFFLGAAIISALLVPISDVGIYVGLMSIIAAALYGAWFLRMLASGTAIRRLVREQGFGELAAIGHLLFVIFPFIAFPVFPGTETPLANYFIHLVGYGLGFIAPFVTLTLVDID